MEETAFYRGEGGYVWEMNLPLAAQHSRDVQEGRLVRVNPDGSPFSEEPEAEEPEAEEPEAEKPAGRKRAAKAPSKEA